MRAAKRTVGISCVMLVDYECSTAPNNPYSDNPIALEPSAAETDSNSGLVNGTAVAIAGACVAGTFAILLLSWCLFGRWRWYSRLKAKLGNRNKTSDTQVDPSHSERDEEESIQDTRIATPATDDMRGAEVLDGLRKLTSMTSLHRKSFEGDISEGVKSGWDEVRFASAAYAHQMGNDEVPYLPEPIFDPIFATQLLGAKSPSMVALALTPGSPDACRGGYIRVLSSVMGGGDGPHPTEEDLTMTSDEIPTIPSTPTNGATSLTFSVATSASQAVSTSTVKSGVIGGDEELMYRAAAMSYRLNDVV